MDYILALIISLFGGQPSDYAVTVTNDVAEVKYVGKDISTADQSRSRSGVSVYLNSYFAYKN